MAKNKKQKNRKKKTNNNSAYASLCAIAPVIKDKNVFDVIEQKVEIHQKKVEYSPTDKLVLMTLGIMSGCDVVFDINRKLRVDRPLLRAFGYSKCADQSVIQDTLNAVTEENVMQMESALKAIWDENNLTVPILQNARIEGRIETIDIDLSGMPSSKKSECSIRVSERAKRGLRRIFSRREKHIWSSIGSYSVSKDTRDNIRISLSGKQAIM